MKDIDLSKYDFSMIKVGYTPDMIDKFKSQLSVPIFISSMIVSKGEDQEDIPLAIVRNDKDMFFLVESKRKNLSTVVAEHVFSMVHHINYKDLSYNVCPVWYTDGTNPKQIPTHFADEVTDTMPALWMQANPKKTKEDFFAQSVAFLYVKNIIKDKNDENPDAFIVHLISTSEVPLIDSKLPKEIRADEPRKIYPCKTLSFKGQK